MKSIVLATLFLALTSCTPKDINQAKTQLDSALQQRDLARQVTILNSLAQHDKQWQQQAQQAQHAQQLLHQARQQYEQGALVEAQLIAAKSKSLNNSFQIDDLLRELGTQYPLTELVNELRQLHSEASRSQLSLQAFFDLPVSDWSIVDLNKKLMLINQAIANINKHISVAFNSNSSHPAYQNVLQTAHNEVDRLHSQQYLLLKQLQQQISKSHLCKFTQFHHSASEKVRNFNERVVYSMINKKHTKLIIALHHESELLYNVKMILDSLNPRAMPMFAPYYKAYTQLLNKPRDYNDYVKAGHSALITLQTALKEKSIAKQYDVLTSRPMSLDSKYIAFAESQNKYRFLYRLY